MLVPFSIKYILIVECVMVTVCVFVEMNVVVVYIESSL